MTMAPGPARSVGRRVALRVVLLLASTGIGLALLEVGLRVTRPVALRVHGDRIVLPRNATLRIPAASSPDGEALVEIRNSLGFRGPEPPADFDRSLTIVAIGGSTTECFFLPDGETWPERLGELLAESLRDVWVANAGLDGHSTHGHLVLLEQGVLPLDPRVVLFLAGANDVANPSLNRFDRSALRSEDDLDLLTRAARHSHAAALFQNLLRDRQARELDHGHRRIDLAASPTRDLSEAERSRRVREMTEPFLAGYEANVRRLVRSCLDAGVLPVLVTQPALFGPAIDDATGVDL